MLWQIPRPLFRDTPLQPPLNKNARFPKSSIQDSGYLRRIKTKRYKIKNSPKKNCAPCKYAITCEIGGRSSFLTSATLKPITNDNLSGQKQKIVYFQSARPSRKLTASCCRGGRSANGVVRCSRGVEVSKFQIGPLAALLFFSAQEIYCPDGLNISYVKRMIIIRDMGEFSIKYVQPAKQKTTQSSTTDVEGWRAIRIRDMHFKHV